jgi:hypothetical protein
MDGPGAGLHLVGQAHALQALQAADQQQALALQFGFVEAFDLHQAVHRLALQVRSRLVHRSCSTSRARSAGSPARCAAPAIRSPARRPLAHAAGDVVPAMMRSLPVSSRRAHDMGVRVVGVPVIDRHPIQPRAQVGLHALHQVPGVGAQVFQLPHPRARR